MDQRFGQDGASHDAPAPREARREEDFLGEQEGIKEAEMYERICERCRRVCFTPEQWQTHECFDMDDKLNAEIALANWDGKLEGEEKSETN